MVMVGVIIAASFLSDKANVNSALYANWTYAVPVFNVAIFCYIAQYAVPEMARGLRHDPRKLPKAITTGMFLTAVLLALVPLAVISLTGPEKSRRSPRSPGVKPLASGLSSSPTSSPCAL